MSDQTSNDLHARRLRIRDRELDLSVPDFWRWIGADLVDNSMRGPLAELLVAWDMGERTAH